MADWPDIEVVLVAALGAEFTDATVSTETGNDLLSLLPFIQVARAAGDDDGFRLDRPLVDIDVYAATRVAANTLALQVRTFILRTLRGSVTNGAVFGHTGTVSAPSNRPYENTGLRRTGATYELFFHPVS
jgi:hypothetical protein